MLDRVQLPQSAPGRRRLLVRLCLFAFCGGLLLLLSSRPAEAAERREPGLLDPVRTTLKATAREVDSLAGRATGSGSSKVGGVPDAPRQPVAPRPRPASGAVRSVVATTGKRGAPAVTSPVRRAAPPTRVAKPVASAASDLVDRVTKLTAPVVEVAQPALRPVTSALAPVTGPVAGVIAPVVPGGLLPLPGLVGSGNGLTAGPRTHRSAAAPAGTHGVAPSTALPTASQTYPARLAADGASSPATRSIRSWPALTGAVSLPGFPASAELPAGGPDPLSTSSGAGFGLAALAAALVLLGPLGRGRARPERSGVLSRSYLPLVSPA
jgi:hypothetical protein